jgi:16S rRNA (cytosine1402-N4)-methyltransferase
MLAEVLDALAPAPGDGMVDATFGAGGYARAILDRGAQVLAFDRDPSAARFAAPLAAQAGGRFRLVERRFSELEAGLAEAAWAEVQGVVFDLGVSSMQLDQAERGFSFLRDGPLDMRMGGDGPTAADIVNGADPVELARILFVYGEEHRSRHIANVLAARRAEQPFTRTLDLAEVVETALGGRRGAPTHPATRTFQALRIAVNAELAELEAGLHAAERVLAEAGRLVVVTFHSLEDRAVKAFLAARSGRAPSGSRHRPPTERPRSPSFVLPAKPMRAASDAEAAANPRARSAKLRAAVRTAAPPWSEAA